MTSVDGGPAWPSFERDDEWDDNRARYERTYHPTGGMSLRDYFAGQALTGMMANMQLMQGMEVIGEGRASGVAATAAYAVADAMLEAREK